MPSILGYKCYSCLFRKSYPLKNVEDINNDVKTYIRDHRFFLRHEFIIVECKRFWRFLVWKWATALVTAIYLIVLILWVFSTTSIIVKSFSNLYFSIFLWFSFQVSSVLHWLLNIFVKSLQILIFFHRSSQLAIFFKVLR